MKTGTTGCLALIVAATLALAGCVAENTAETADEGSAEDSADELREAKPLGPDPSGRATRYPIVLVHGFTGSRHLWNFVDVPAQLTKDGHKVFHAELPPFGTPDTNGAELAKQVDQLLRDTGASKVNIIAHSKGGLDARAYISKHGGASKVASLTTVATPHQGTYIADVALKLIPASGAIDGALSKVAAVWGDHVSKTDASAKDNDIRGALEAMSEKGAERWNAEHPAMAGVHYQSWAGISKANLLSGSYSDDDQRLCENKGYLRGATWDRMDLKLAVISPIIGHGGEAHDGLSTVKSSKYGEFLGCIPADHQDDVGRPGKSGVDSRSGFDHVRFYRNVAFDLQRRGF